MIENQTLVKEIISWPADFIITLRLIAQRDYYLGMSIDDTYFDKYELTYNGKITEKGINVLNLIRDQKI